MSSTDKVLSLLEWITSKGGHVHTAVIPQLDPTTGLSAFAEDDISEGERLISCPFHLAITPEVASDAISEICRVGEKALVWPAGSSQAGERWNDRMRIAGYLSLHWVQDDAADAESSCSVKLRHGPYIASLPPASEMSTPLYFTDSELELLRGTNLYGAVLDRRREWKSEWEAMRAVLLDDGNTWDRYLASATYLSSRAFPSKLLQLPDTGSSTTSAIQTSDEEESHPVLLPGVDLFNHSRGQPIVWLSSETPSITPGFTKTISLVTAQSQRKGQQLYNNYGPKPNEELLLGYGFVIEDNPDDMVVLKVGRSNIPTTSLERLKSAELDPSRRFFLKRDGKLDPDLLAIMRILISPDQAAEEDVDSEDEHALHEQEEKSMQLEMDVLGMLGQMLDDKLEKMEEVPVVEARENVKRMCEMYRKGQVDILNAGLVQVEERIKRLEGMMDQGMGGCPCCT